MPVVKQPANQLVHWVLVVKVIAASVQTLSVQVPVVPEAVHVQTLAPDVAAFPEKILKIKYLNKGLMLYR